MKIMSLDERLPWLMQSIECGHDGQAASEAREIVRYCRGTLSSGTRNDDEIIALLWDYLKRDPEHKDRRQTGWGTKTQTGLVASVRRAVLGDSPETT